MLKTDNRERYLNSLEIQRRLSYARNYNNRFFHEIEKYLGDNILDVGCATGNFTGKIADRKNVCVIDIEEDYIEKIRADFKDHDNVKAFKFDISSEEISNLGSRCFDTIICFNVLEHIEDDKKALQNMYALLKENGYLCLVVPAFQCIFGEMDRTDGHCRRYGKGQFYRVLKGVGFDVLKLKYINLPGFFGWWFNGKVLKRKYVPFYQMLVYDRFVPLIGLAEKFFNIPFGQSLVSVVRK